jgi:SNF2 family DNA or RNA helicase
MVVFTQFLATQAGLAELLRRAGHSVHLFSGNLPRRQRDAAVESFREEGGVLLATEAGAEGRNLQFAHHVVNFDLPWNPMRIEQRLGRVHRIGQERPVFVHTLVSAGTIEADLVEVLEQKVALFELVLGELDVILGKIEEQAPFEEEVFRVCLESGDAASRRKGLEAIGELMRLAKEEYLNTRQLTDAVTGGELAPDA